MTVNADDSKIPNKDKSPKRMLYAVIFSLIVASIGTLIFLEYDEISRSNPLNENYEVSKWECDGWLQEGIILVEKNRPFTNMETWLDADRNKMIEIENKVLLHCGTSKLDVIQNMSLCLDTWVILDDLLENKMVEREINSLSESDQDLYHFSYSKYFDNDCDLLQEDIDLMLIDN